MVVVMPLCAGTDAPIGLIAATCVDVTRSSAMRDAPSQTALPFVTLVASHIEHMLKNTRLLDDLATIVIIAVLFSDGVSLRWLVVALAIVALVAVARRSAVRSMVPYVLLAAALWYAVHESGVHATIAGVILGFLTPAVAFYGRGTTASTIEGVVGPIGEGHVEDADALLLETARVAAESVSPLARMETRLHP